MDIVSKTTYCIPSMVDAVQIQSWIFYYLYSSTFWEKVRKNAF